MNRDQIAEVIAREVYDETPAKLGQTLANRILTAADAIMALDGWQPLESAPRDGTEVLLWFGGDIHHGRYNGPSDGAIYSGTASRYNWFSVSCGMSLPDASVRFWRPLPTPPGDAG